ncbi:hypothetical protein P153DRAFT_356066 [Dothidotthia symphoricarpi CBS 119687]|uniref:Uncharacterized protein n=1 Tax=Dothidotthia symphoricarpi CBS 119687 TaxID=1392245 RepID=A0A6A6AGU2_9PLEO|nr:uncharacterized protein P153DRAFT_356066 [Dothidotthia symphoricarpi CBS 119687]KAF2130268.1 hypothetical protein P153DRAFT_356066 [Dothidotthia symphoricarpi CBS 119687]
MPACTESHHTVTCINEWRASVNGLDGLDGHFTWSKIGQELGFNFLSPPRQTAVAACSLAWRQERAARELRRGRPISAISDYSSDVDLPLSPPVFASNCTIYDSNHNYEYAQDWVREDHFTWTLATRDMDPKPDPLSSDFPPVYARETTIRDSTIR